MAMFNISLHEIIINQHYSLISINHHYLVGGLPTPLKNTKVSWDHEIPNRWKVIKAMFQTTNQLIIIISHK